MADALAPNQNPLRQLGAEDELTTILEGIGEGFYSVDRDWRITRFNSECTRHFGKTAAEAVGNVLWELFPGARQTGLGQKFIETMASRQVVRSEAASVIFPGRILAYRLFPLSDGMGIVFRDVTELRSAEQHRELLINELNHRVKNTLATVQSVAAQTLRNANVDPAVQRALEARLLTLSNVNNVLVDKNWASARMADVVMASLGPHRAPSRDAFAISGPELRLKRRSAVAISMALHELSTNAHKYGALRSEKGRIRIDWRIDGARFRLTWQEQDGPPVKPPGRKGFGSRLIERGLSAELRGQVAIEYRPTGVVCTIDAPLASLAEDAESPVGEK